MATVVCVCVCLFRAALLHYCKDMDVTLGMVGGALYSCARLGGFTIGTQVSLLWQHTCLVPYGWQLGAVVSVVGRTNEDNQHRARLVP